MQVKTTAKDKDKVSLSLSIESVNVPFGGRYTCEAANAVGRAEASARVDVHGPPFIRKMEPRSLVAGGSDVTVINCPYSGHPVEKISWVKDGKPVYIFEQEMRNSLFICGNPYR